MNNPTIYNADKFVADNVRPSNVRRLANGTTVLARPLPYFSWRIKHRLKCAWLVLTGRADVLEWTDQ